MNGNELKNIDANKATMRESIIDFESLIRTQPGATTGDSESCPLEHSFTDGIYVRQISIPKGMYIVGKIHKHSHPNFLLKGTVEVVTEEGHLFLEGPCSMISPAGTKRALYTHTDVVWTTIHHNPTNTQDLSKLEEIVIADSYEKYESFKKLGSNKAISVWNKILKKLIIS
jgi:hypothetical protein